MSDFQHATNTGTLFYNESDNPKAPFVTGTVNVDSKLWRLSVWKNEKNGKEYFGVKVEPANKAGNERYGGQGSSRRAERAKEGVERLKTDPGWNPPAKEFNDDLPPPWMDDE